MLSVFAETYETSTLDVFVDAHKQFGAPDEDPETLHGLWLKGSPLPFFVYKYVECVLKERPPD